MNVKLNPAKPKAEEAQAPAVDPMAGMEVTQEGAPEVQGETQVTTDGQDMVDTAVAPEGDNAADSDPIPDADPDDEQPNMPAPEGMTITQLDVYSCNPSDWNIKPANNGIEAVNSRTGAVFNGTISEFNAALKG